MNLAKYILVFLSVLFLSSCEEKLLIDLESAEPRLVIDASLGDKRPCVVFLSLTQDYWNQEYPTLVGGGKVTLSDESGDTETLVELEDGYFTSQMMGVPGKTYTLTVELDGEKYVAQEFLPYPVPITDFETYKFDTGGDIYFYPKITYMDPKGAPNYYLYKLELNGRRLQGVNYDSDKNSDGKKKEKIIFFDTEENDDEALRVDDRVWVELQSIGEGAYNFYSTLSSPGGMPNSNPVSNFSGDVLGMFKTYSTHYVEFTITEEDLQ